MPHTQHGESCLQPGRDEVQISLPCVAGGDGAGGVMVGCGDRGACRHTGVWLLGSGSWETELACRDEEFLPSEADPTMPAIVHYSPSAWLIRTGWHDAVRECHFHWLNSGTGEELLGWAVCPRSSLHCSLVFWPAAEIMAVLSRTSVRVKLVREGTGVQD